MITDLDILVPEQVLVKLRDRKSKEIFEVDLFMPGEIGLLYIKHEEEIQKLFNTDPNFKDRFSKKTYDIIYSLLEMIFKPQYDFMTAEWCRNNIDFYSLLKILIAMGKPIYEYLKTIGIVGTPEKNPQTEMTQ